MEVGNMNHDKWFGKDGWVMIETTKYAYAIKNNPQVELTVYNGISQQLLVNCGFTTNNIPGAISSPPSDIIKNSLLLGLCWYLFLPVAKQHAVEHAA